MATQEVMSNTLREQLRFKLEHHLVNGEAEFEHLLGELQEKVDGICEFEGKIATSPENCLALLQLSDAADELISRIWTYRLLQESIDTRKQGLQSTLHQRISPLMSRLVFADLELKSITEATWNEWTKQLPVLAHWNQMMNKLWKDVPHTLSRVEEELLAQLSSPLSSWQEDLYQQLVMRTKFADFEVDGKILNSMRDHSALLLVADRSVREAAWIAMYEGYAEHRDLYAFALNRVVSVGNQRAQISKYDDALHVQARTADLTIEQIEGLWSGLEAMTPELHRFLKADISRRSKLLGIPDIKPWDMEQEPSTFTPPVYPADTGFALICDALQLLGTDVSRELKTLLTPEVGRVDMYGGQYRRPGAFSVSPGKIPGFFFLDQYHGTIDQMRTIAHEAGHTVHHSLINAKGLPNYASRGPSYVTETAAMTFEEILHMMLLEQSTDANLTQYLKQKAITDMVKAIRVGWIAKFESDIYATIRDRASSGQGALTPEEFDELAIPSAKARSLFYPEYQQPLQLWQIVHHYYTVPLYNLNYLISSLLTMELAGRIEQDKNFAKDVAKLFSHPFDRPTADILKNTVGVDFTKPDWYQGAAKRMAHAIDEFEGYVGTL